MPDLELPGEDAGPFINDFAAEANILLHAIPSIGTESRPSPSEYYGRDIGFAEVFSAMLDEIPPYRTEAPVNLRVGILEAPSFALSILPETQQYADIFVFTNRDINVVKVLSDAATRLRSQEINTPEDYLESIVADEGDFARQGLKRERAIMGDYHFLSSAERFAHCQEACRNSNLLFKAVDLAHPLMARQLPRALEAVEGVVGFMNLSNRGDDEAIQLSGLLDAISITPHCPILRSSRIEMSAEGLFVQELDAPHTRLAHGPQHYKNAAMSEHFSSF